MYKVGMLVKIKRGFLGEPKNVLGYIYENYTDFNNHREKGCSVITENGVNLGGFSFDEQDMFLEYVENTNHHYNFTNLINLNKDYRSGWFDKIFKTVKL